MTRTFPALLAAFALSATPALAAPTFKVDPGHAAATFEVTHLGTSTTHGRFNAVGGRYALDANDLSNSFVEVTIDAKSIDTNNKKRDDHLRGPDFFNAKRFPKLTFKSKRIERKGKDFVAHGTLTLHGVSKNVSVVVRKVGEGKDPWGGFRSGYDATFDIKRSDFGMNFMQGGISDRVAIRVSLEGIRQ